MIEIRESVYRAVARTGCAIAFSAVLAIGLGAPSARAQTSLDDDRNATASAYLTGSAAYNGYSDGFVQGAEDLRIGPNFRAQHDENYLRAATGYTRDMGPFDQYQDAFKQAYARGYSDAHAGRERDPAMFVPPAPPDPASRNRDYGSRTAESGGPSLRVASAKGYNAGYTRGAEDRKRGGSFGYREDDVYRAATDGYDTRLGDETRFQVVFRQLYARGYSDGFNGRERYTDTTVLADERGPQRDRAPRPVSRDDILRIATMSGYHEGYEQGASDRRARQSFGYRNEETYQQATARYDRGWNSEREYQTTFRRGYVDGYKAAFYGRARNVTYENQYNQYGGSGHGRDDARDFGAAGSSPAVPWAAERGYRTGYDRGQHDRRVGASKPNPQGHGAYTFALDGWLPDFGDRPAYQHEFRTNFVRGYGDGFSGRESSSVSRP